MCTNADNLSIRASFRSYYDDAMFKVSRALNHIVPCCTAV